jgi:preprotein translocase subunit SecG
MIVLLTVMHVIFCVFLILVILLQTGKGAGMGVAFGGSSNTVFGPRGAGSFIGKATGIVAALFMVTSMVLAYVSSSRGTGVAEKAGALAEKLAGNVEEVDLAEAASQAALPDTDQSAEPEQEPAAAGGDGGTDGGASAGPRPLADGGAADEEAPAAEASETPPAEEPPATEAGGAAL